jgi:hypothetical protein
VHDFITDVMDNYFGLEVRRSGSAFGHAAMSRERHDAAARRLQRGAIAAAAMVVLFWADLTAQLP